MFRQISFQFVLQFEVPNFIGSLCHIQEHCGADLSFFKHLLKDTGNSLYLVYYWVFTSEFKLWFQIGFFSSIIGLRRLISNFSNILEIISNNNIRRNDVLSVGGFPGSGITINTWGLSFLNCAYCYLDLIFAEYQSVSLTVSCIIPTSWYDSLSPWITVINIKSFNSISCIFITSFISFFWLHIALHTCVCSL